MAYLQRLVEQLSELSLEDSVEYWDVRVEDSFETSLQLTDGEVVTCTANPSLGAFLRVRKDGFWFFDSTTEVGDLKSTLEKLSRQKVTSARWKQSPKKVYKAEMHETFISHRHSDTSFSSIPLEQKLSLAQKYDNVLGGLPNVASRNIRFKDIYKMKSYLNSVGTKFEFDFNQGGFSCGFTLKENSNLFDDFMRLYGAKFSDLEGHEDALMAFVNEARKFLRAPSIEPGKYTVILDPEVAGVFTHESFGHKSEADFMLGNSEALEEWKIGKKIAADCLTIVDHGLELDSSGYCPIDDDGTPARKNYLIKNGLLAGRLHSRETAGELSERPTGNSRAMSFEFEPIVRMTSTYIEPGPESINEILLRSEGAVYVEGVKHGSGLSTFTIAPLRGYRIGKNGLREPVRVTVISGSVFETLKNVKTVSSEFKLHSGAIGGCGKNNQWPLPVADGGPFVVVDEMQVS
jgi:TldD protein